MSIIWVVQRRIISISGEQLRESPVSPLLCSQLVEHIFFYRYELAAHHLHS
jgi:hypothetical protein